jgi:Asp-tRNA(Asn)/Glu-tRNA(Gln) amidotransferase A subunit family amidase
MAEAASALELTERCLARIEEREDEVRAWQFLDPEHARAQARALDGARAAGRPLGPLFGIPVGVKDIVDTADMPTENGTPLHAGRRPERDAVLVARLRAAGAVILGKTVTTELAVYTPGKTRNPHDPTRTPGGSSSGSAAAVAAGMVTMAIGSQTNGSVIRPAAYCGVVGYKPTHGLVPRTGVLAQSPPLDTMGVMAEDVLGAARLADVLIGHDPQDPDTRPQARSTLAATVGTAPAGPPRLAFVRTPVWSQAEPALRAAFEGLAERLGAVPLDPPLAEAHEIHRTIMEADLALSFGPLQERGRDRISARLNEMIDRGATVTAVEYNRALRRVPELYAELVRLMAPFDALLTPGTTGTAPPLETTGSPTFCTIWTLLGTPAVTIPLLTGGDGLPIGVQLVGRRGEDGRLLQVASRLSSAGTG